MFNAARTLAGREDHAAAAKLLDRIATQAPHFSVHDLAARAHRAAGHGDPATRHALIAARLAPGNAMLAARAENALDLAFFDHVRPFAWGGILFSLLTGVVFAGLATRRGVHEKQIHTYVSGLSGRVCLTIDGQTCQDHAVLTTADRGLTIDVMTKGRYGLARPDRPTSRPDLHVTCSNAAANRTIRLTPVRDLDGGAVRISVKDRTLAEMRRHPGHWRIQAAVADRRLAVADLMVPEPMRVLRRQAIGV